jgi:hypothetical protein
VNQRGVPYAQNISIGANANSWLDGWKGGAAASTASMSVSGVDNLVSVNSGSIIQIIRATQIEGGTYVLSWTGTSQARVFSGTTGSGTFAVSPIVVTLNANTVYGVEFNTGTVSRVQLELGSKPTSFERRDDELIRCQKRFQRHVTPPARGVVFASTPTQVQRMAFMLPVTMDAVPTMTTAGTLIVYDGTNSANVTSISSQYHSRTSVEFDAVVAASPVLVGGRPAVIYNSGNGAYIDLSCEP